MGWFGFPVVCVSLQQQQQQQQHPLARSRALLPAGAGLGKSPRQGRLAASGALEIPGREGFRTSRARRGLAWLGKRRFLLQPTFPAQSPARRQGLLGQAARPGWANADLPPATGFGGAQLPASMLRDFLGSSSKPHLLLASFRPRFSSRLHETGGKSPFPPLESLRRCLSPFGLLSWGHARLRSLQQPGVEEAGLPPCPVLLSPCPAVPPSPSLPSAEGCCPLVLAAPPEPGAGGRSHPEMFCFTFSRWKHKERPSCCPPCHLLEAPESHGHGELAG